MGATRTSFTLRDLVFLKSRLLTEGCSIDPSIRFPMETYLKKIHLYAHSDERSPTPVPDDVVLGTPSSPIVARVRYRSGSSLQIHGERGEFFVQDLDSGAAWPVSFLTPPTFSDSPVGDTTVGTVCSFLGRDVLGVVPSNHCFYFRDGSECRFCEIQDTHRESVEYRQRLKGTDVVTEAVAAAVSVEPRVRHVAVTSGNVRTYDYTAELFARIGRGMRGVLSDAPVTDVLATLMPPNDLRLIEDIKESGFTKIYFSLEIFERRLFDRVCPGKAAFGYDAILEALLAALEVFGRGNVYTNFVYGLQALDRASPDSPTYPDCEREVALEATADMLERDVIPAFTLYHYGGLNSIGPIGLVAEPTFEFFEEWGRMVAASGLVPPRRDGVLFGSGSLSNTLFNDGFTLVNSVGASGTTE